MSATSNENILDFVRDLNALIGVHQHPVDQQLGQLCGQRVHIEKYNGSEKVISGLRRVSKPGLRVYAGADELPRVLRGLGIAIISTSKGVMTDKAARAQHIGGEVLAFVW